MKILKQFKSIFGRSPLLAKILVNKSFSLKETTITGKIQLIAKNTCTIEAISYELTEYFELAHNNATDNKMYSLGKAEQIKQITVTPLEPQLIEFSLPVNFSSGSKSDSSVYSGDMALMNKFSDKAKKMSSKYKLSISVQVKDYSKPITESVSIQHG